MNKSLLLLAFSILLVACLPATPELPATDVPIAPYNSLPTPLPADTRIIIRSSSLSLIVDDPVEALSALEQAVQKSGGFVVSSSYWYSPDPGGYSNLNARVPSDQLPELRRAALKIASQVQSDSTYSQDVTSEYRLLHDRLSRLDESESRLWLLITETEDRQLAASLSLLHDLIQEEMSNVQSQLLDYDNRSILASFDVTFNQTLDTQIIIE